MSQFKSSATISNTLSFSEVCEIDLSFVFEFFEPSEQLYRQIRTINN